MLLSPCKLSFLKAWKTDTSHNIYLDLGDSDFPSDHIRNKLLPTTVSTYVFDNYSNHLQYFLPFPMIGTIK